MGASDRLVSGRGLSTSGLLASSRGAPSILRRRQRRRKKSTMKRMASPATPPTTPPAMAGVCGLTEAAAGCEVGSAWPLVAETLPPMTLELEVGVAMMPIPDVDEALERG